MRSLTVKSIVILGRPIAFTGKVCKKCFRWDELFFSKNCCECHKSSSYFFGKQKLDKENFLKQTKTTLKGDGDVEFYPEFCSYANSAQIFKDLFNSINWIQHKIKVKVGGYQMETRYSCFQGDNGLVYKYGNSDRIATPWTPTILLIKKKLEQLLNVKFNVCLLNLYIDSNLFSFLK
jgi:hypothetical protein